MLTEIYAKERIFLRNHRGTKKFTGVNETLTDVNPSRGDVSNLIPTPKAALRKRSPAVAVNPSFPVQAGTLDHLHRPT